MNIGIIDCGGANLNSIYYSFKRININAFITNSITELKNMDAYVLPGVGSAGIVMNKLKEKKHYISIALSDLVKTFLFHQYQMI